MMTFTYWSTRYPLDNKTIFELKRRSLIGQMEGASGVCYARVEGHEYDAPSLLLVPLLLKAVDVPIETTLSNGDILNLFYIEVCCMWVAYEGMGCVWGGVGYV